MDSTAKFVTSLFYDKKNVPIFLYDDNNDNLSKCEFIIILWIHFFITLIDDFVSGNKITMQ